ncbi:MAG: hypothetical protein ACTTKH_02235 [Treponema sp.]
MSLFLDLQKCKTEEDVKDCYIKALHLKGYQKNLIDIQTKEIWFEAKLGYKVSIYSMFTQLLFYVNKAINEGEYVPPFLCVIDSKKAALMKTETVLPLLNDKSIKIKWGKSASEVTQDALDRVSQFIGTHFVSYNIEKAETEFIEAIANAIKKGEIIRTQITPDNLKSVFDKWVEAIGKEIMGAKNDDYVLLFYADIMSDGTVSTHENLSAELLHKGTKPAFLLNGTLYELGNIDGYHKFWSIYNRPPLQEYRNYLLERRDSLIPLDVRSFNGAYYTPLKVVEKAYELLNNVLGSGWQKEYIVWDPCCGVGNLETKHGNVRNIYMSTLDEADINVMNATKTCVAAMRFQYDYLNDDITETGEIDYSLTNKLPIALQKIITEAKSSGKTTLKKKILILMNPPYAEATNADNTAKGAGKAKNKVGVAAKTKVAKSCMAEYGKASNELFTQFIARIAKEIPNATLAMFSKLKYINAPNFEEFRNKWNATYLGGFVVHSKAFDGIKGNFPIGFLVWQTHNEKGATHIPIKEVSCEVLDKNAKACGEKTFYNIPTKQYLNVWISRPKRNDEDAIPLSNAIIPTIGKVRVDKWADRAIAYMYCGVNDFQHAGQQTVLYSSPYGGGNGFYVTPENLWQSAVVFTVRRIIPHTWLNDRDQFFQGDKPLPQEFINDCLVWMLFSKSNLTASADGLVWNGKTWSITNHFIPYTEEEVGSHSRFESDFLVNYMNDKSYSEQAIAVLEAGKAIWQAYFSYSFPHIIREKFKLGRADVGWYQIRQALKALGESEEYTNPFDFGAFEKAYSTLTQKLSPQVYELGFLKR